jgi:hypothetical protein
MNYWFSTRSFIRMSTIGSPPLEIAGPASITSQAKAFREMLTRPEAWTLGSKRRSSFDARLAPAARVSKWVASARVWQRSARSVDTLNRRQTALTVTAERRYADPPSGRIPASGSSEDIMRFSQYKPRLDVDLTRLAPGGRHPRSSPVRSAACGHSSRGRWPHRAVRRSSRPRSG